MTRYLALLVFTLFYIQVPGQVLVDKQLTYTAYKLPQAKNPIEGFSLVPPGTPVLPIAGGVYMPEMNMWLLKPDKEPIQSIDFLPESKSLIAVVGQNSGVKIKKLFKQDDEEQVEILASLPGGFYQIKAASENEFYLWGLNKEGWHIDYFKDKERKTIFRSELPVITLSCSGKNAVIFALPKEVIMLTPNSPPKRLLSSDRLIHGVDFDEEGNLYVSNDDGLVKFDKAKQATVLAKGLKGRLVYNGNYLFIVDQEIGQMLKIKLGDN